MEYLELLKGGKILEIGQSELDGSIIMLVEKAGKVYKVRIRPYTSELKVPCDEESLDYDGFPYHPERVHYVPPEEVEEAVDLVYEIEEVKKDA